MHIYAVYIYICGANSSIRWLGTPKLDWQSTKLAPRSLNTLRVRCVVNTDSAKLRIACTGTIFYQNIYVYIFYFNTCSVYFYYFVEWPTKAQLQLIYILSCFYMFRHCRVIFNELVFITSPSYISISIAAVGNTV